MNVWVDADNSANFNVWDSDHSVNLNSKGRPWKKVGQAMKGVKRVNKLVAEQVHKRCDGPKNTPCGHPGGIHGI
jgi:hypothetical protein